MGTKVVVFRFHKGYFGSCTIPSENHLVGDLGI